MTTENSAVVKIVAKHAKEYNKLIKEHNTLLEVHLIAVNECADIEAKRYELRKDNKELRKLLKEAQAECVMLQESLDQAERDILEMKGLNPIKIFNEDDPDFDLVEGEGG